MGVIVGKIHAFTKSSGHLILDTEFQTRSGGSGSRVAEATGDY